MKKIILVLTLGLSLNAHALIMTGETTIFDGYDCSLHQGYGYSGNNPACVAMVSTTSVPTNLPTILVEGNEMDLNSNDANERLQAELDGVAQPVLLNTIATDANISVQEVRTKATSLKVVTVRDLLVKAHQK